MRMNLGLQEIKEFEHRKLSEPNAGFGLSQCFVGNTSLFFKVHRDDLESPWLSVRELSVRSKTHMEMWNFDCTPFNGSPFFDSFNEYLSSARRDRKLMHRVPRSNWSYLICRSINIYIHSIGVTIYSWLILKLCISLSLTPAYAQIRASKIPVHGLYINLHHWL